MHVVDNSYKSRVHWLLDLCWLRQPCPTQNWDVIEGSILGERVGNSKSDSTVVNLPPTMDSTNMLEGKLKTGNDAGRESIEMVETQDPSTLFSEIKDGLRALLESAIDPA